MSDPVRTIWFFVGAMLLVSTLKLALLREFPTAGTTLLLAIGFWVLAFKPRRTPTGGRDADG